MDHPTTAGAYATLAMFAWIIFLLYGTRNRPRPLSLSKRLGMFCHVIPVATFFVASILAQSSNDYYLVWLGFLISFRYWRTAVQAFFWTQYRPALPTGDDKFKTSDCTVICATVGPEDNLVFDELTASILVNRPARLIFACNTVKAADDVRKFLVDFRPWFEAGTTHYQRAYNIPSFPLEKFTEICVEDIGVSNKRQQIVAGLRHVKTPIMVSVDDTAIWTPQWLARSLPAFNDDKVGLVGTRKWVKQLPRHTELNAGHLKNLWNQYISGFWNTMGGVYLIRHNFEIRSTNCADGGVFCISARSNLIRSEIVQNDDFCHDFTHEYVLPLGTWFKGFGPLNADDDNFVTRYVINKGWDIKVQCGEDTTMTTILGVYPKGFKFPEQCTRWSRSTFRQNPLALFVDRTVWIKWPLTTWTTYLPWLYNAAALWDGLAIYILTRTNMDATSSHPYLMIIALFYLFQLTKLIKTHEWWMAYPKDFCMYYVIPAYQLFTYYHSFKKLWTAITFWNTEWSGRPDLPPPEKPEMDLKSPPTPEMDFKSPPTPEKVEKQAQVEFSLLLSAGM
jgi:cellulose synthase/poly-beta-1,6-N-acetylglucosamine synthase-like glycosyltransferase